MGACRAPEVSDDERVARAILSYVTEPGDPLAGAIIRATGAASLDLACRRSVAVTGAASAYGAYLAAEFGASLAGQGCTVIAGCSFGVDAAAHRGALSTDGATVAVLACGLDLPYPAAHAELLGAITARGALVSEAPPGVNVSRLRFRTRNRVIAALATGTLIVEAAERSGALAVARHARDLGRPVMAGPGPVTSDLPGGCNDLIRSGDAVLVTRPDDVTGALPAADRQDG